MWQSNPLVCYGIGQEFEHLAVNAKKLTCNHFICSDCANGNHLLKPCGKPECHIKNQKKLQLMQGFDSEVLVNVIRANKPGVAVYLRDQYLLLMKRMKRK